MNTKLSFVTIQLVLACFALAPTARAVDPPPDGGYPGFNTAEGGGALGNLTTGEDNTAIGFLALFHNTTGSDNTATGSAALVSNTTGIQNTATGRQALLVNTTGSFNTANGAGALNENTTGEANAAIGNVALFANTTGSDNTATGNGALLTNTTGSQNTATGSGALSRNVTAINNTAVGFESLASNATGDNNTGVGFQALYSNTAGIDNTASGLNALFSNAEGSENTANGPNALQSNTTGNDNTAVGHNALFNNTTGSDNIAVGHGAGQNLTTGNNNIDIGNAGVGGEANTIRIGSLGFFVEPGVLVGGHTKTFIAGISGAAVAGGAVHVNAAGQLGTAASSQRFKDAIKPMDKASQVIYGLKPVTFHYKKEVDPDRAPQFGLVAEEVEKVNPDLVIRDADGKPYTVRYEAVNAMLLNEFLKEHRKVEEQARELQEQKVTVNELKKGMETVIGQLKRQATQIQKVDARIDLNSSTPQIVFNSHNSNR
jgi:hypothetical protein